MSNRNKITCGCKIYISSVLLQSDLNKWRLSHLSKLDNLYINYASNRLLQISKNYFIEYKNKIFPNNSHINLRACDAAISFSINGSNIPIWDCILNCFYDCPRMNAPYLESSEQLDHFFTDSFHKIKFYIFKNKSKCSIHVLRPFKYINMCELCDNILDKDKRVRVIVKNFLFFSRNL